MKFLIEDWAGNELREKQGKLWVALRFKSFDDGWDYIYQNFDEDTFEDLYVLKEGKQPCLLYQRSI